MTDDEIEEERRKKRVLVEEKLVGELRTHMHQEDDRNLKWHMGREIPLAVIIVLVLQTFGVIWWAASVSGEQRAQKDMIASARLVQSDTDKRQDDEVQRSEGRLLAALDRVNAKLDRLIERNGK